MLETRDMHVRSLTREDPLEEGMATRSSVLAWRIPWTEEPGGLHSMGSQRVRHDWAHTHTHTQATRYVLKRAVSKVTWGWIRNPWLLWISVAPRLARTCPAGWTCHFPPGISSSRQITGLSSTVPSLPSCSDCPVPSHRHGGQSTHLQ